MKKSKKVLSLFLALVMVMSTVNFPAFAEEGPAAQEQLQQTETPAEVQAFLDAVAAIPEIITAENAAEAAEYVYGPVSEAYEALLGTEYEERADVQEAAGVYAAAIDAVDAVLDMESDNYALDTIPGKTPTQRFYVNGREVAQLYVGTYANNPVYRYDNPATGIEIYVDEDGSYQYLYTKSATCHCGNVLVEETPDWIAVDSNRKLTDNNPGIIDGKPTWSLTAYKAEDWTDYGYEGYPSLQIGVTGAKPGQTSIVFQAYQNYYYYYTWRTCKRCGQQYSEISFLGKWIEDTQTLNVTVNARYQLTYDLNGGTGSISPTTQDVADTSATLSVTSTVPTHPEGKTFKGWKDENGNMVSGSVTLNWSDGLGGKNNPVTKTLTAVWEEAKTYTVIYTDGVAGEIVFYDQVYEDVPAGAATPKFEGTPVREGYTFMGWAPAVKSTVDPAMADTNGNIIYTATWKCAHSKDTNGNCTEQNCDHKNADGTQMNCCPKPALRENTFKLTYHEKLGSDTDNTSVTNMPTPNPVEVKDTSMSKVLTISNTVPQREGYTFVAWQWGGAGQRYNSGAAITLTVPDGQTYAGADLYAIWTKNPTPPELKLDVVKSNNGGLKESTDGVTDAYVDYTVTVTNKSEIDLYGLRLTDILTTEDPGNVTYTFGNFSIEPTSTSEDGKTNMFQLVERNTKFAVDETVTLSYTVYVTNNGDDDVTVKLVNAATADSWDKMKPAARKARAFAAPAAQADEDDDKPAISGTGTTTTGGTTGGTSTEGTLKGKKSVIYSWTGLPEGTTDPAEPATVKYRKNATVTVNTTYTSESKVTVNGETYTFSGWTVPDTVTVTDGKFAMPGEDVTISGTWTKAHVHDFKEQKDANGNTVWADGKAPDCIHDGTALLKCSCGETKEEVKAGTALNHSFPETWTDDCTSHTDESCTGHSRVCTRCNGTLTGGTENKEHTYGEWITDTPATMETVGAKHRECACGHIENGTIPTLDKVTITIKYVDENGNEVGTKDVTVPKDSPYDVTDEIEIPEGYEANGNPENVTGTADGDKTVTVPVKKIEYTVTFDSNGGSTVASQTVKHGEKADKPADPTRENYRFDGWTLNGEPYDFNTPVTGNITLVAQWTYVEPYRPPVETPDYYTLTIRYVYADGSEARPSVTRNWLEQGDRYSVTSPVIEGYTADLPVVEGTMPGRNETVTVTYTAEEDVEPTTPPLVETPDVTETPEPTETPEVKDPAETEPPEETENLGDNDTPLTGTPDDEGEDLGDNDTPLADVPQTGDSLWLWVVLALSSAAGLAWIAIQNKRRTAK